MKNTAHAITEITAETAWASAGQLAQRFGVTRGTINNWRKNDRFPKAAVKQLPTGPFRYDVGLIELVLLGEQEEYQGAT